MILRGRFTFVELLVLLAIIAILAAFLMPGLQSALRSSHIAACSSQLRQTGQATFSYVDDQHGLLPTFYAALNTASANTLYTCRRFDGAIRKNGFGILHDAGYLEDTDLLYCPARPEDQCDRTSACRHLHYSAGWEVDYFLTFWNYLPGKLNYAYMNVGELPGTVNQLAHPTTVEETWKARLTLFEKNFVRATGLTGMKWTVGGKLLYSCARDQWCGAWGGSVKYPFPMIHGSAAPMLRTDGSSFIYGAAWPNFYVSDSMYRGECNVNPVYQTTWWAMAEWAVRRK